MAAKNFNVTFDPQFWVNAVGRAYERTIAELNQEFIKVIETPGIFSGFPQDIVDSGALRDSQKLIKSGPHSYRYEWGVTYALAVHEGYQLRNGGYQPGRPWTEFAIKNNPPAQILQKHLDAELKRLN